MSYLSSSKSFYQFLIAFGNLFQNVLLLALRVYFGFGFYIAGANKLANVASVSPYFASLNIPFPEISVYFVALVEIVCGVMLLVGFASRLAAIPLIITMVVALMTAHSAGLAKILTNSTEFLAQTPVSYLIACLTVFAFGPGSVSIDYAIEKTVFKR